MKIITLLLSALLIAVAMALLFTFPVMWLWNWLMPDIFGLIKIDFWQALGLTILCNLLFKSASSSTSK